MDDTAEAIQVEMKSAIGGTNTLIGVDNQPLIGFLNAAPADSDKINAIADFFRGDEKEFTDIDLLQAVRHIESRLGTPALNERRVDRIYQYIKLQGTIDNLSKERDILLR